jgi:lipid-A-disaccharide synthase-like uncharacterized protein
MTAVLLASVMLAEGSSPEQWAPWFRMPFQDNYWLWKGIGAAGLAIFSARFIVQWIYSEYHKESRIPTSFWWLSLVGSLLCLLYALRQQDSIFILGYSFNCIPYARNLVLIARKKRRDAVASQSDAAPGADD